jgi:hypothetical protein
MIGMDPDTSDAGKAIEKAGNAIGGVIGSKVLKIDAI